ncbi:DUF2510 domain-containing protein [Paenarthrobacter sp. NPDC090522]|uniref:DUF2510 domain-containing protein n=1 Tax=Paenarthrobacter sp. NPDC090522 TaxID=3364383 RepID=UPI0037F11522
MTDARAPGQLPQPSTTAAPGWYADPADPRYNRWWDGSAWTAHVGPPASRLLAQRPLIGPDTPCTTSSSGSWLCCRCFLPSPC